jgi:hypothetical protein
LARSFLCLLIYEEKYQLKLKINKYIFHWFHIEQLNIFKFWKIIIINNSYKINTMHKLQIQWNNNNFSNHRTKNIRIKFIENCVLKHSRECLLKNKIKLLMLYEFNINKKNNLNNIFFTVSVNRVWITFIVFNCFLATSIIKLQKNYLSLLLMKTTKQINRLENYQCDLTKYSSNLWFKIITKNVNNLISQC